MPATLEARVLVNPKNNRSVETHLTDLEAVNICAAVTGNDAQFANDLANTARRRALSPGQLYWLHLLAIRHSTPVVEAAPEVLPPAPTTHVGDFARLTRMFQKALHYRPDLTEQNRRTRKLRIILETPETRRPVQLMLASAQSRYTGQLMISNGEFGDGNVYYGRVDLNGDFFGSANADPEIVELLRMFAGNPHEVARQYGHKTGKCCFCNRKVEDEKGDQGTQKGSSVEQGFGLVCARRFGLYHTNLTVREKTDYWTVEGREPWME